MSTTPRKAVWRWYYVAVAIAVFGGACTSAPPTNPAASYPYEVHFPAEYAAQPTVRWPVILSLHGAGGLIPEDNLIPAFAGTRAEFPFIIVTPITRSRWNPTLLARLLDEVESTYRVDRSRVYVAGISMGAYGAWNLAAAQPQRFAAIALVAGGGNPAQACNLRHLPVWVFHNRDDPVVPFRESEQIVNALRACSGNVRFTAYDSVPAGVWAHNAWRAAYFDPQLYAWFLQHHTGGGSSM